MNLSLIEGVVDQTHKLTDPVIHMSAETAASTYSIARLLMRCVYWVLDLFGMADNHTMFLFVYAVLVFLISFGIGYLCSWIIMIAVNQAGKHLHGQLYSFLRESHFFSKASQIIPSIIFLILIQFTLTDQHTSLATWLSNITWIYLLFTVCRCISIIVSGIWLHIDSRENKKHLPLKGIVQLVKGIVWILFAIIVVAILVNKSPGSLLAGLGAFAAVLMLIFKDSILGVVAGVQLSENDSLHVGDWIKVPGTDANGNVIEVSLTSVKVENWDKTISTIPPYNLVSGSFTNYRSMQQSGTRRIQRAYNIDADSIVPCTPELLAEFAEIPLLKDWIEKKIEQKKNGKECDAANPEGLVNGSIETNLGVFRAYLQLYLNANSNIDKSSDCFVSTLQQTSTGIPLQIYCFTTTSKWIPYEAIQSALFEHIAAMLPKFHLYVFELNTGRDTILEGYVSGLDEKTPPYGLPYPFFTDGDSPVAPGKGVRNNSQDTAQTQNSSNQK